MIILYILLAWSGLAYLFAVVAWPHIVDHMEKINGGMEWVQNESAVVAPSSPEND